MVPTDSDIVLRMAEDPPLRQLLLVEVEWVEESTYRIAFTDRDDGSRVEARCTLSPPDAGIRVGNVDPNVFANWNGDAESVRSVIGAVAAVDRARRLSMRDYGSA